MNMGESKGDKLETNIKGDEKQNGAPISDTKTRKVTQATFDTLKQYSYNSMKKLDHQEAKHTSDYLDHLVGLDKNTINMIKSGNTVWLKTKEIGIHKHRNNVKSNGYLLLQWLEKNYEKFGIRILKRDFFDRKSKSINSIQVELPDSFIDEAISWFIDRYPHARTT